MKVLFVCHRVPFPPSRGGKIRPFNIVRHLSALGHEVVVASVARTDEERAAARGLEEHCARAIVEVIPGAVAWTRMIARLPTATPSSFGYFYSPLLAQRIQAELRTGGYDLVFVHCSSVASYVRGAWGGVRVLDYGDVDSQKWREYSRHRGFPLTVGYWLEAVKLERTERRLASSFDLCTCTTHAELDSLRRLGVRTRSDWFPNGVDADRFKPNDEPYDPELIVFVGRMDYYPNQQGVQRFCAEILPALRRRRPNVRFQIVGADPPPTIVELGRLPNVTVTGSVPDIRPFVTRAALTVAPLEIARGTQNKILESMAMGVPVVCSRQAAGGVDAVPGVHLLSAGTVPEYVDAIERILGSAELRQTMAGRCRERILTHHSWASSMRRLDGLIESAFVARRRAA